MRRGLALLPGVGVVSASHDQSLRLWTLAGECCALLQGHAAIVYAAAASADGSLVASAAEDNTARLWRPDGAALQSIEHPGGALPFCAYASHLCCIYSSSEPVLVPKA
jgi:phospholipase A-2-activating protein